MSQAFSLAIIFKPKQKEHIFAAKLLVPFSFAATCNANNKTYNLGETIVFHTVTDPVDNAMCDMCRCSAGGITDCAAHACDLGVKPSLCDNWITNKEGRCCPLCGEKRNGNTIKGRFLFRSKVNSSGPWPTKRLSVFFLMGREKWKTKRGEGEGKKRGIGEGTKRGREGEAWLKSSPFLVNSLEWVLNYCEDE